MEFLQNLLDNSELPLLTALLLGLMTAISPCPMATNISAIGYIGREVHSRKKVFVNGLFYTLGRAITYSVIGIILFFGASQFKTASFFNQYGEKFLGPLLLIIGVFLLDIINIRINIASRLQERAERKLKPGNSLSVLLLGIVFALAFCPYSGVLYFGMLIPLTITNAEGLYLPVIYAIGTGLPVIIISWLIAFALSELGSFFSKMQIFEKWFRNIVAFVFILAGVYYTYIFYFKTI